MTKRADIQFRLPVEYKKRKNWYVASCPVLDVVTQGDTKRKARENLREALFAFLETCIEIGTIGDVLASCGFKPSSLSCAKPAKAVKKPTEFMNIPIELLINRSSAKRCHA